MTNGAGATTGTYEYDVFGETGFKYTGRQSDEGTGLYYLRARYYDPNTGRFPSTDPFPGPPGLAADTEPVRPREQQAGERDRPLRRSAAGSGMVLC
ncbi:MAG: RHS repeat-associated core domain-containing protein [Chloroflexia bacterium]